MLICSNVTEVCNCPDGTNVNFTVPVEDNCDPTFQDCDPIGGEGLFILNEELRFPIFRKLQGVVFYDAGNVFRTLGDYSLGDLRHVAGAGLRVATPIGPFRVEYGAILDREEGDRSRGEFFFSIGQAF